MANLTIFSHTTNGLSWSSSNLVTAETQAETTIVLNSSGARVYWTEGSNNGSFTNSKTVHCTQGTVTKVWGFSDESEGAAKITLTVTGGQGGGGGQRPAALKGEEADPDVDHGHGHGHGHGKDKDKD